MVDGKGELDKGELVKQEFVKGELVTGELVKGELGKENHVKVWELGPVDIDGDHRGFPSKHGHLKMSLRWKELRKRVFGSGQLSRREDQISKRGDQNSRRGGPKSRVLGGQAFELGHAKLLWVNNLCGSGIVVLVNKKKDL
jgi:hypothetical protein